MENLFDRWKTKIPKYDEQFRETLFDAISKKFGGSEKQKADLGKNFSTNYELYIYAFFLGLYNDEFCPIPDSSKKVDFSHAIQHWGSKSGRLERKDFTILQEYMFASLVAQTGIDIMALEKGEVSDDEICRQLIHTMESFTNGGLVLIREKLDSNPNYFLQQTSFLNLILGKTNQPQRNS
ncbi:hypothetical protein KK062_28990 [Fulvivirgaceae bacterium PWU5]|uniref:Glycoside hydrolase family 15 n=1 Tax=Dawidia cretensis TaxID=2782350 RepID=A0AAP2E4T8_9BACT|nr:hypothetical protein [Dawidia cretensis]MBT1712314.1 hypothetical protein [Dawidia cretensis]